MALHPQAGQPIEQADLIDVPHLLNEYYRGVPSSNVPEQAVAFGTSGHRGSSLSTSFTETHIAAISQALADYRYKQGIRGPMFIGMDTHALSEVAFTTAVEVLVANGIRLVIQHDKGFTPTPVISHAILDFNLNHSVLADGVVITPSHNPPEDGGFKYNATDGGPADTKVTLAIETRANEIIAGKCLEVKRITFDKAMHSGLIEQRDFAELYISELDQVIDMESIAKSGLSMGTDPLGGAGIGYWARIAEQYKLDIKVVNQTVDPTFSFMMRDKDGKTRMDCSSPFAMSGLVGLKDKFDIAFGNDPDFDRHGIVTPTGGLMNANHYLAVAIQYLYQHRSQWPHDLKVGKTLVSSAMIDRVAQSLGRPLSEMPVGFKWFVQDLLHGKTGFAGEESAGGIFLRKNGSVWATDKDGIILNLLAAEITATTGKDPSQHYQALTQEFGVPKYVRLDVEANLEQKDALKSMQSSVITSSTLADEPIRSVSTHATGNDTAIGGVKVATDNGWFAARPSGTENIYKIYAESFKGENHLQQISQQAQELVNGVFIEAGINTV